jgi:hypothetical protein
VSAMRCQSCSRSEPRISLGFTVSPQRKPPIREVQTVRLIPCSRKNSEPHVAC